MIDLLIALGLAIAILVLMASVEALYRRFWRAKYVRLLVCEGRSLDWSDALAQVQAGRAIFVQDFSMYPSILWIVEEKFIHNLNFRPDRFSVDNENWPDLFERTKQNGLVVTDLPRERLRELIVRHGLLDKLEDVDGVYFTSNTG